MRSKWVWSIPIVIVGLLSWNISLAQEKKQDQPKPEPKKVEPPKKEEPKKDKDLVDVAKAADNMKQFVKLLDAAGLTEELKGKGPFTVFAPTDEAFTKLGKEKLDNLMKPENKAELKKILLNHVVKGKNMAADIKKMKEADTMSGKVAITEKDGQIMFGAAKITKMDVAAGNGVIQVIDMVVMPAGKEMPKPDAPKPDAPKPDAPKKPAGGG